MNEKEQKEYDEVVDLNLEKIEKLDYAKERYSICKSCDQFNHLLKLCGYCHCFMPVKTQFKVFSCPMQKWGKVEK
jgi:hypothetical protein